jgi:hypothetical protein
VLDYWQLGSRLHISVARAIGSGPPARRSGELDVVCLGGSGERSGQSELKQGLLGDSLHPGSVRGLAARVRVIGKPPDLDGVLGRARRRGRRGRHRLSLVSTRRMGVLSSVSPKKRSPAPS